VAIGFEHIPANMYMIPLGLLAGADVTIWEMIWKNFIPTTLGNIFAGSIIVACGYSYSFGALGKRCEKCCTRASEAPDGEKAVGAELYREEEVTNLQKEKEKPNSISRPKHQWNCL